MPRNNIPPTRTNLLQMRQELQFAQEGYEILDQKREVLAKELVRLANDAETLQEQMEPLITAAYRALKQAKLMMGQEHVEWAALAVNKTVDVQLKFRGVRHLLHQRQRCPVSRRSARRVARLWRAFG